MTHYITVMHTQGKWGVYAAHRGTWKLLSLHETKSQADQQASRYDAELV